MAAELPSSAAELDSSLDGLLSRVQLPVGLAADVARHLRGVKLSSSAAVLEDVRDHAGWGVRTALASSLPPHVGPLLVQAIQALDAPEGGGADEHAQQPLLEARSTSGPLQLGERDVGGGGGTKTASSGEPGLSDRFAAIENALFTALKRGRFAVIIIWLVVIGIGAWRAPKFFKNTKVGRSGGLAVGRADGFRLCVRWEG